MRVEKKRSGAENGSQMALNILQFSYFTLQTQTYTGILMSNPMDQTTGFEMGENDPLDSMFARLNSRMAKEVADDTAPASEPKSEPTTEAMTSDLPDGWLEINEQPDPGEHHKFFPQVPESIDDTQINGVMAEGLLLRYLLAKGEASIRECSKHVRLPYNIVQKIMKQLKDLHCIEFVGADVTNDYQCRLTERGSDKAKRLAEASTYYGAAPVSLRDYIRSVSEQSIQNSHPTPPQLREAFADLSVTEDMLERLGPAVNSGRGLFLYGPPGNGKTSIAERISLAFGELVWIPRAIFVDSEIIRIFDPLLHEEVPLDPEEGIDPMTLDQRWIRIKRPTVVVGGELTMKMLDISFNQGTGVSEAPLQMKANCGVLVIDDFGRQQCGVDELLNRWIVPLEKRYDFLNTLFGKKICVPFDQLVIFSTNLEPRDLVDDAFLRRIPYKIEVADPAVEQFRAIWQTVLRNKNIADNDEVFDYLISYYRSEGRPMRMCHARDLIQQVENYSLYHRSAAELTMHNIKLAIANYFSVM